MIAWINFAVLIACTLLVFYFEVKSAVPRALEKKIGAIAYTQCSRSRMVASLLMTLVGINYVVYFLYPLPLPLARIFPWAWWVSASIASLFGILAACLWWQEMDDAGKAKQLVNEKYHLYKDIYENNHHPQAASELPFWWSVAFLLNSPFLVLFSLIWVPIFEIVSYLEVRDMLISPKEYKKPKNTLIPKGT